MDEKMGKKTHGTNKLQITETTTYTFNRMNLYSFYSLHLFASLCISLQSHNMPSIHINSLCQAAGTLKCITLDSPGASWRCLLSRVSTVRP
jgi:hypothetical protein